MEYGTKRLKQNERMCIQRVNKKRYASLNRKKQSTWTIEQATFMETMEQSMQKTRQKKDRKLLINKITSPEKG